MISSRRLIGIFVTAAFCILLIQGGNLWAQSNDCGACCSCAQGHWYDPNRHSCLTGTGPCSNLKPPMPDGDKGGGYFVWNGTLFVNTACLPCQNLPSRTMVTGTDAWTIASGPVTGSANVTTSPSSAWYTITGTKWVGPGPGGTATNVGDYTYELQFSLCKNFKSPTLTVTLVADNSATVFLNGCSLGGTVGGNSGFATPTTLPTPPPSCFQAGCNTLKVVVHNSGSVTGLDLKAVLSAAQGICH